MHAATPTCESIISGPTYFFIFAEYFDFISGYIWRRMKWSHGVGVGVWVTDIIHQNANILTIHERIFFIADAIDCESLVFVLTVVE